MVRQGDNPPRLASPNLMEPTNKHYDFDPDLFCYFLGPTLKYSSGLYLSEGDRLERAQGQKLEFVTAQLGLGAGDRLLDVGCGWGSLVLFVAEQLGCGAVGVTPSKRQAEYVRDLATAREQTDRITVVQHRFQEVVLTDGSFDGIAMLGSIVHMPEREAVLAKCYRLLRPSGRLYLSESCFRNRVKRHEFSNRPATRFVREAVFGSGDMVPLSLLIAAAEDAGFSITGLTDLTRHYQRTIEDWTRNLEANRGEFETRAPGLADTLLRYFEVANAGWGYTTKHYAIVCTRSR